MVFYCAPHECNLPLLLFALKKVNLHLLLHCVTSFSLYQNGISYENALIHWSDTQTDGLTSFPSHFITAMKADQNISN